MGKKITKFHSLTAVPSALMVWLGFFSQAQAEGIDLTIDPDIDFTIIGGEADFTWDGYLWVGGDRNKVGVEYDGELLGSAVRSAEFQFLYSRYFSSDFDLQVGVRYDAGVGGSSSVTYGVLGVNSRIGYWMGIDVAFFFSEHGDVLFDADLDYTIPLASKVKASVYFEAEVNLTNNAGLSISSGLSDIDAGVIFLYEINSTVSPYIDFNYFTQFGSSKTSAIASGDSVSDFNVRVGLRKLVSRRINL